MLKEKIKDILLAVVIGAGVTCLALKYFDVLTYS